MRRFFFFLAFLFTALVALIAVIVVGIFLFDTSPSEIIQGMSGMMGGGGTGSASPNVGLIVAFAVLIVVVIASLIGLVYFWYRPDMKRSAAVLKTAVEPLHQHVPEFRNVAKPYESVVKSLTKDEQRVLDILVSKDGKCPLEYLSKESGLTPVKTHRIVARLSSKGIVLVGKSENANEVQLINWLHLTTGYGDLDELLLGGIPEGYSVLLGSSFSDERQLLIKKFLEAGIKSAQITFYVTVDPGRLSYLVEQSPLDFYLFVCNPRADSIVKTLPNVFKLKGIESLTDIDIALAKAYRQVGKERLGPRRACIEIVSDVLLEHHAVVTRKWLTGLIPELRANGFTSLAVVNPQMHSAEELEAITGLFEGDIRISERQTENGVEKLLKVKKMYNQQYMENEIIVSKERLQ